MTYSEIESEVAGILATLSRPLSLHAKVVITAWMQETSGLTVVERCPYCDELLTVAKAAQADAWSVSCPCGRSHDTMRGL